MVALCEGGQSDVLFLSAAFELFLGIESWYVVPMSIIRSDQHRHIREAMFPQFTVSSNPTASNSDWTMGERLS